MLTRIFSPILFLVITLTLWSCKKSDQFDGFSPEANFTVTNKEETMPVWVYGKNDAKYIVLAVHGGPGSDALDFRNYQGGLGFKELETQYLVAYWQQRASGQSQGPDNKAYYTISQYVEDCDKVIDQLIIRYPGKKIVLFGHSWGGMLTSAYLSDATRQAKIVAWINAAGVDNGTVLFKTTQEDILSEANARIAKKENVTYWEDVKNKAKDETLANFLAYRVVEKIGEVTIKVNNDDFKFTKRALKSNQGLFPEIVTKDYSNSLAEHFKKPVLFLWGKYDFAVSKQLRDALIPKLTTNKVSNINFPASGHYMMFHEPTLFAKSIRGFVEAL